MPAMAQKGTSLHSPTAPRLTTPADVTDDLSRTGYALVPARRIRVPPDLGDSLATLVGCFDDLPPDPYLPDGGRYRYRRHTRYIYRPDSGELRVAENPGYYQTAENNPFAGGQWRTYEELHDEVREGAFLAALIDFAVT